MLSVLVMGAFGYHPDRNELGHFLIVDFEGSKRGDKIIDNCDECFHMYGLHMVLHNAANFQWLVYQNLIVCKVN